MLRDALGVVVLVSVMDMPTPTCLVQCSAVSDRYLRCAIMYEAMAMPTERSSDLLRAAWWCLLVLQLSSGSTDPSPRSACPSHVVAYVH